MRALVLGGLMAVLASGGHAQAYDAASLIAQMERNGANLSADERHAVEVERCVMTTYRWKHMGADHWVLWSSFRFEMGMASLVGAQGKRYTATDFSEMERLVIVSFSMADGTAARHEMPFVRQQPKGDFSPSPRNDGTTHYFAESTTFLILHQGGPEVVDMAKAFTDAYQLYVAQFCAVIG